MNVRWSGAGKQLTCPEVAEQEPPPGAKLAAHCRSPRTRVIFKLIIAAIGGIKAMMGGRIPDVWFRTKGARRSVGLRHGESLKDPRSAE